MKKQRSNEGMKRDKVLKPKRMKLSTYLKRNYDLYLMLLPTLIFVAIFDLAPMYGILLAFKDYDMFAGWFETLCKTVR